jgi:glycosyltransferase involved in cell wall biosynthesis
MEPKRLLYVCDLNLKHGGAQRITYKTIGCLSKVFRIIVYLADEPSPESLSLLDELHVEYILDYGLDVERLKKLISAKKIDLVLVQWEYGKWIVTIYKIKRAIDVRYAVFLHELPFIGTPLPNTIIKNWYFQAFRLFIRNIVGTIFKTTGQKPIRKLFSNVNMNDSYEKKGSIHLLSSTKNDILEALKNALEINRGLKNAEKVIAMGRASKFYIDHFLKIKNVIVIEHNASSDIPIDTEFSKGNMDYDICFMASRLTPEKGIFEVLRVAYSVKKLIKRKLNVVLLGKFVDNDVKNTFLIKIRKLNLESDVFLPGFVSESEKAEILNASKVFLYPSKRDCFSISLSDALSQGLPAIMFDLPFASQFGGPGVYKVRLGDIKIMSRKVVEILNLYKAAPADYGDLKKKIRENFFHTYSWDLTCKEQIMAITSILAAHNSPDDDLLV